MYLFLQQQIAPVYKPNRILDIGANKGQFCDAIKNIWPLAHITSIEAGEKYRPHLEKKANQVHIAVLGDSNRPITMSLIETKPGKGGYSKGSNIFGHGTHQHQRQMQTLDEFVDADYDFIKQDVQGAELLVIKGAPHIFAQADMVLNEVSVDAQPSGEPSLEQMNSVMQQIGFNYYAIITPKELKFHHQIDVLYTKKQTVKDLKKI